MRVAGIGFRAGAPLSALREALDLAGSGAEALATRAVKADAEVLRALASELGIGIVSVPDAALRDQKTLTHSPRVHALIGTGSMAEAAALAAAGPGALLTGPRATSRDGMATAAIAERVSE